MAADERQRHQLHLRLEAVLGADEAAILMEHLPPGGWASVTMKSDLAALDDRIMRRFDLQDEHIDLVVAQKVSLAMAVQTRALSLTLFSSIIGVSALVFTATRF